MLNKLFSPILFILLIVTVLLAACTPAQPASPALSLDGSMWNLSGFRTGDDLTPPVLNTHPTLDFKDGQVSGSAGCNGYGASYTLDGDKISFGSEGFMSTMMYCEAQGIMDQETRFLDWMQKAESVEVVGEQLIVHTPEGDLVFDKAQPLALEGTNWLLSGIVESDAVVSTVVDQQINIQFQDGQVAGSSGCNRFFADYQLDGEKITLGVVGGTEMACEEDAMLREGAFLSALAQVTAYKIERTTLTLLDANGNALMSFSAAQ